MHSILLVIEQLKQNADPRTQKDYNILLSQVREILRDDKNIESLSENVLLFEVSTSLQSFCNIIALGGFSYKCIFFEDKPEWVIGSRGNDPDLDHAFG
jgi:hypothetical protein